MKIFFIGSIQFSEKILIHLIKIKANIKGVYTLKSSKNNSDHIDLTNICVKNNIPCKYTDNINSDESLDWIKSFEPDIIFCFGWSRLLKNELLTLASLGVLGYHPTLLPANRGRHPIIWSLVLGLDETASTFYFMDKDADSGNILSQYPISIKMNDNANSLYNKLIITAIKQINEFLPNLESNNYDCIIQDHSKANYWRKREIKDGQIDWRMTAQAIYNLVRGLSKPYPGAHFLFKGKNIKVLETKIVSDNKKNIEPGKVLLVDNNGIIVKAGEDSVCLIKTDPILKIEAGSYL